MTEYDRFLNQYNDNLKQGGKQAYRDLQDKITRSEIGGVANQAARTALRRYEEDREDRRHQLDAFRKWVSTWVPIPAAILAAIALWRTF